MGYTALKFDVDIPNPYSRDDFNRCLDNREIAMMAELVAAVREAVGDDTDIAIDCHWRFSAESAIRLTEAVAPTACFGWKTRRPLTAWRRWSG